MDEPTTELRDVRFLRRFADFFEPLFERWFAPDVRGLERIPPGPALYVANHSGGFLSPDTWIFGLAVLRERGLAHVPVALAHDVVSKAPLVGPFVRRLGSVPASSGGAHRVFTHGEKVLVYPGGDLDAFRPSSRRDEVVFGARRGYVRLALREGVPVVPVVSAGSHAGWWVVDDGRAWAKALGTHRFLRTDVLPLTWSLPWGLTLGAPPYVPLPTRIVIEVLEPIAFDRSGEDAASDESYVERCHAQVHGAMQAALSRLAVDRRAKGAFVNPLRRR